MLSLLLLPLALAAAIERSGQTYSATSGQKYPVNDAAPVGVSFEFFAFPGYYSGQIEASTKQCMANLDAAAGAPTPARIGGTTQDRATFDPNLATPVQYTVASAGAAPASLTYGPSFFSLANSVIDGPVVIGLNRELNNLSNSIAGAHSAISQMSNFDAFELGNEPEFYGSSSPIAQGSSWTPAADRASQTSWQSSFGSQLNIQQFTQAGVYLEPPTWANADLAPAEGSSLQYVKRFCNHFYPQSACGGASTNLQTLMAHSTIVSNTQGSSHGPEVSAAKAAGRPIVLGETNSATCGGGGISPTFGAALWIIDYVFQALITGYDRLYFHQGTIGNCQYCWWGRYDMGAPYYGAYFAASALNGITSFAQLDDGTGSVAVYALYSGSTLKRAVIYNSAYYASGTASSTTVTLTGLSGSATGRRLTAPYATSRQDQGQVPTFAGQSFVNGNCAISGTATKETYSVQSGLASFTVRASEALLVDFS